MSTTSGDSFYSLSELEKYAKELIQGNSEAAHPTRVAFAIAGGGGHALSTLASTPGASSLLVEGVVTYDRQSFQDYVNAASFPYEYSSPQAAKLASETALRRALRCTASSTKSLSSLANCVGIGCASALASGTRHQDGKGSIVATRADGRQWAVNLKLLPTHSRKEQDIYVGSWILRAVEHIQRDDLSTNILASETVEPVYPQETDRHHDPVVVGAKRLLSGEAPAVLLLPKASSGSVPDTFQVQQSPILPSGSLLFPGSFNPPHEGHVGLLQACLGAVESSRGMSPPAIFEVSLSNADKPDMDTTALVKRVKKILDLDHLPEQWGVLLTRAPLFSEKVEVMQQFIVGDDPKLYFVIGTDTMVRILNPKYYGDEKEAMLEAIRSMKGAHFCVGGRLEQGVLDGEPRFVTGHDELDALPNDVRELFTLVDFRMDISSSELRRKEAAKLAPK